MGALWTPPHVEQELLAERLRDTAERLMMVDLDPLCVQLTAEARKLDECVSIVKAKDNAQAPGIRPGFYHVMRFNQGAPLSFLPIEGKDGSFVVPTSKVVDKLRASDLWNSRVVRDRQRELEDAQRQREREQETDTAEIIDEAQERWAAATRTQVSLNPDVPWTQNASPASRRDRDARKKPVE